MSDPGSVTDRATATEDPADAPPRVAGLLRNLGLGLVLALVVGGAAVLLLYSPEPAEQPAAVSPQPTPISEEDKESEVVLVATEVLENWSTPGLGYREWWAGLRPLLTAGGREAYAFTDPDQVPTLGEVRPTRMLRGSSDRTATAYFRTEAGRFGVDLSRQRPGEPWRAHRILFPGQRSVFS